MMEKRKITFYLLSFLLSFFGCAEEKAFTYQLTDEQFVEILSDLHISESAAQHLSLSHRDSMAKVYLAQVLEIHEVSKEIFEPNYFELKRDPQKLVIIYDQVIKKMDELKSKKEKVEKLKGQKGKQRTKKK